MSSPTPTAPLAGHRPPALALVREVTQAARDTHLLLKLRWRLVRSAPAKAGVWVGLLLFLGGLFLASQVGTIVRSYAEQGIGTAAGQFAVNYVIALNRGELGLLGATAVGSVFIIALFTPFSGATMQALASGDDLAGLRPTRLHRYTDSVITNAASAIGFLQLLTLTGVGSLLTLDGGRPGGLLFMWAVWPALLLLTVAEGWAIELLQRRYGKRTRRLIGLSLLAVLATAVVVDPDHGRTLFGIGDAIAATLASAATGDLAAVARNLAVVLGICVALLVLGLILCRAALRLPAAVAVQRTTRRRLIPVSTRPNVALMQLLWAQVWRTPEIRRPLSIIFIIGLPAVWFSGLANVMTTLVVAIPLAVALAFGINIFGILGPAMPWLAAQPHLMRRLLGFVVTLQIGVTLTLAVLVWAPGTLAGRVDLGDIAAVAAGTVASTLLTTRSAAHKSVNRPFLVRLAARGDVIVPPLTAINYTFRFALWSGQIGVLIMTRDTALQITLVGVVCVWTALRFWQLARQWKDRDVQAFVIKQVAAA